MCRPKIKLDVDAGTYYFIVIPFRHNLLSGAYLVPYKYSIQKRNDLNASRERL
jgi:hypothetical protein